MKNEILLKKARETGLIPLFSTDNKDIAYNVLKSCYEGGVRIFEYTNRDPKAPEIFEYLISRKNEFPDLVLGIGTIMDVQQCEQFHDLGADFIICPIMDPQVAAFCSTEELPWVPGCGTLTEIINATRLGAQLIKVFPASVLGPGFIKACLGPCPELNLMPTGGVTTASENLEKWFSSGVTCVGIGSELSKMDYSKDGNFEKLRTVIESALNTIQSIRKSR